jgi:uncharacterized Zn finger protein
MGRLIDRRTLRRMAGARAFERGEDYCAGGQVRALGEHEDVITAKVLGTREYRVKLWVENGDVEFSCTCPVGTDGAFCKHCVAVGLAWLEQGREGGATSKKPAKPSVTMDDVRTHLTAQGKEALVDLLVERAMEDDRLRQRLLMKPRRGSLLQRIAPPSTTLSMQASSSTTARRTTTRRASTT